MSLDPVSIQVSCDHRLCMKGNIIPLLDIDLRSRFLTSQSLIQNQFYFCESKLNIASAFVGNQQFGQINSNIFANYEIRKFFAVFK
jgi:hypothetical protein